MAGKFERTLIILKPDAVQRSLVGTIVERFEQKGLRIVGVKMLQLQRDMLEKHYAHHKGKPFFEGLMSYMTSAPCVLMVLEGNSAIDVCRRLVGVTNSREAAAGTIRGDFGMSVQMNLVHASDSKEVAEKEILLFFKKEELLSYRKADEKLVYGEGEV